MATLNEISYNILNKLNGGRTTHNEYLSLDQIKFNVHYYRALILHRDLNKDISEDDAFYQNISVAMEAYGTKYRSTNNLPKLLRLSHRYPVRMKDNAGNTVPMTYANPVRLSGFSKYTPNEQRGYMENKKLVVESDTAITSMNFNAIFEDPIQAYIFDGEDPVTADNLEYPLSMDIVQRLTDGIVRGEFELIQLPPDTKADNLPETVNG